MTTIPEIENAAEILSAAEHAVASCGAGISAESGIATFRDPGGVWDKLNPAEVGTTGGLMEVLTRNPEKLLPFFLELLNAFDAAEPNAAHRALYELGQMGILKTVVTQNIDNLQQEAGSSDVIEVHGNAFRLSCTACARTEIRNRRTLINDIRQRIFKMAGFTLPAILEMMETCADCGAVMRPDVVMFGETVRDIPRAFSAARACDVLLAIGTSGVVYPAAYLPFEARDAGAAVIVINPNENPFSAISDVYIPGKAAEVMPELVEAVRQIRR